VEKKREEGSRVSEPNSRGGKTLNFRRFQDLTTGFWGKLVSISQQKSPRLCLASIQGGPHPMHKLGFMCCPHVFLSAFSRRSHFFLAFGAKKSAKSTFWHYFALRIIHFCWSEKGTLPLLPRNRGPPPFDKGTTFLTRLYPSPPLIRSMVRWRLYPKYDQLPDIPTANR
jgi:hypothetical protein